MTPGSRWKARGIRPGLTTASVLTVYGAGRFIDEFWKQPDLAQPVYWGWMSKGQLLTIPVIVAGLSWLLWYRVHAVGVRKKRAWAGATEAYGPMQRQPGQG